MTMEIGSLLQRVPQQEECRSPQCKCPSSAAASCSARKKVLPQGIHSTATAVFLSCMLKKVRKRQTSCWVCFLLIQYLQECCLILVHRTHLSPKNLHALVKFNQQN